AANHASACVWQALERFFAADLPLARRQLLDFAQAHMVEEAKARICRRLAKDPHARVRKAAQKLIERGDIHEVALPLGRDGDWDATGWLQGTRDRRVTRHKHGKRPQEQHGVPVLNNVGQLRQLLGIRSPAQLGYFLLASDAEDGPYTRFT